MLLSLKNQDLKQQFYHTIGGKESKDIKDMVNVRDVKEEVMCPPLAFFDNLHAVRFHDLL